MLANGVTTKGTLTTSAAQYIGRESYMNITWQGFKLYIDRSARIINNA